MNERKALKLALEALEEPKEHIAKHRRLEAIIAIKEALAQPEKWPENVQYTGNGTAGREADVKPTGFFFQMPPQRKPLTWQPIETAPKDGTDILAMYIHIDTQIVHAAFWIGADDTDDEADIGWWSYEYSEVSRIKLDDWMEPTHWMPLPTIAAHGIKE